MPKKETPGCLRHESEAVIDGDTLVIRARVATLAHAFRNSEYFADCAEQGNGFKVTDESLFAKSVASALNREEEDGGTPITRMFDDACQFVSENGEDGIEEG